MILIFILLIILCGILYVLTIKKKKIKKELYQNNKLCKNNKLSNNCIEIFNPTKNINIPSAVNIPDKNNNIYFNTGVKNKNNNKYRLNGKYVFPIPKLTYDGVWDNKVYYNKDTQNRKWYINKNIPSDGLYSGNKYLILPEKTINIGDTIYSPEDNCNKFYPDKNNFKKELNKCSNEYICQRNDCFNTTGLIKNTDGKWNINGL